MNKTTNLKNLVKSAIETAKEMDAKSTVEEKLMVGAVWNAMAVALDQFLQNYLEVEDATERQKFLAKLEDQLDSLDEKDFAEEAAGSATTIAYAGTKAEA